MYTWASKIKKIRRKLEVDVKTNNSKNKFIVRKIGIKEIKEARNDK